MNHQDAAVLETIFSGTTARVFDLFLTNKGFDYSANEVVKITGLSYKVVMTSLNKLMQDELLKSTPSRPIKWKLAENEETALLHKFALSIAMKRITRISKRFPGAKIT